MTNSQLRSLRMLNAKRQGTHTTDEWYDMLEYFNFSCVRCFEMNLIYSITKDHIIPIYQGGSNSITNIQPLCKKCNCSKGYENTDCRILFCNAIGIDMPNKWLQKEVSVG